MGVHLKAVPSSLDRFFSLAPFFLFVLPHTICNTSRILFVPVPFPSSICSLALQTVQHVSVRILILPHILHACARLLLLFLLSLVLDESAVELVPSHSIFLPH
ncbi:hypothetical protein D3C73_930780 [compost metagenome]